MKFAIGDTVKTVPGAIVGGKPVGTKGVVITLDHGVATEWPIEVNFDGDRWWMNEREIVMVDEKDEPEQNANPVYIVSVVDAAGKAQERETDYDGVLTEVQPLLAFLSGDFTVIQSIVIKVKE